MNIGLLIAVTAVAFLLFILYFLSKGIVEQVRLTKYNRRLNNKLQLMVSNLDRPSSDIITFRLKRNFSLPLRKHYPGQYLTLELPVEPGKAAIRRAYSIANWNRMPFYYEVGIKREENGKGTTWLFDNISNGLKLSVKFPQGHFYLGDQHQSSIVLIAGGIGITPLRAMIQSVMKQRGINASKVYLFYACRFEEQLTYHSEFLHYRNNFPGFYYIPILSRPNENWQGETGRINADLLLSKIENPLDSDFFLCAGNALMEAITEQLQRSGIKENRIHFESFGVSVAVSSGNKYSIKFDDRELEFEGAPTLFHALEDSEYPLTGDCRTGTCGSCKIRIKSGQVKYLIKPEVELLQGEILPCCCVPTEDLELY